LQKVLGLPSIEALNQKKPCHGFDKHGTPFCPGEYPMVYQGTVKKHLVLKLRCPRTAGQKVECRGQCACTGPYGLVVRVRVKRPHFPESDVAATFIQCES
jgi:hypothetical protein